MTEQIEELKLKAIEIRRTTMETINYGQSGHTGSDMSCADILTCLYYSVMNIDPKDPNNVDRDRYVQSKGHAAEVLWAVLAEKGFFKKEELKTFYGFGSRLIGHPNNKVEGIEMNTGSLGHGLSLSVGMALAAKKDKKSYQTYVLMGDGELAEGSVWEGAMAASHYKLDNLTAIIDRNGLQISGKSEDVMGVNPLKDKFEAFGWQVIEVEDGNSIPQLLEAFNTPHEKEKPKMIIAHTTKGKGLKFAENQVGWHHKVPTEMEFKQAMEDFDLQTEVITNGKK